LLANRDNSPLSEWIATVLVITVFSATEQILVVPTILSDEELQSIKTPTLFIVGENEKLYSAEKALNRLHAVAPQIETAMIPKCGHDVSLVQGEMMVAKVLEFLNKPYIKI